MASTAYSENSCDSCYSNQSIVSSVTFGQDLQEKLDEILQNPRVIDDSNIPMINLDDESNQLEDQINFDNVSLKYESLSHVTWPDEEARDEEQNLDENESAGNAVNEREVQQSEPDQINWPVSDAQPEVENAEKIEKCGKGAQRIVFDWPDSSEYHPVIDYKPDTRSDKEKIIDRFDVFGLRDPVPESTTLAYRNPDLIRVPDTSPYPPPDANQRRFNCTFPAPKPPTEAQLNEFHRVEFWRKARESIKAEIKKSEEDKLWFESFMKEKMQLNVFDADLDKVNFGAIKKGLTAAQVIHSDLVRLKNLITCNLCEQIGILPKECARCSALYCLSCVHWLQSLPSDLDLPKITVATQFLCIDQKCLVSCQLNGYPDYRIVQSKEVYELFRNASYRCSRKFCEDTLIVENLRFHLTRCKVGPVDYSFDKTLQLPFIGGPIRSELQSKPKSISSLLPAHIKKQDPPKTLKQYYHQKAMSVAFLLKCYEDDPKSISPEALRAQANFRLNYWNNVERMKDPTAPISEQEQFALAIGFPSCAPEPIPDVPRRWPTTVCSRIPSYLLKESITWRRWNAYIDDDGSSISSTSSCILYALDIEDPESPFIRVNPFERLSPSEAEVIQDWLEDKFPSCINPYSVYKAAEPSQKQKTIENTIRMRKHLANSFAKRPNAKIPPMMEDQLKVIEELSANCLDKHLIFSINMFFCGIKEDKRVRPRPCWITIVDGNCEVVYETFVKYKEIEFADTRFHGLKVWDLKFARNLAVVRDQVLKYLACAKVIIGYGLINQLINLGLTRMEIKQLHYKMREITNFYSPYLEHPMNLHAISFLWFSGYTLPAIPHSPVVEAITALRLYLLQWIEIEKVANEFGGIHNENAVSTCRNRVTSALLFEFDEGIKKGHCKWPEEWKKNPRIKNYPTFNDNCTLPSKYVLKRSEELCRPDCKRQRKSANTPQSRVQKHLQDNLKRSACDADKSSSSQPKSPRRSKPLSPIPEESSRSSNRSN